ncbi:MAG: thermonuclease family protein [Solirubrobacterales bacterium]|nr:thermonuclease family protein [Solirubrobacterales bacterium]
MTRLSAAGWVAAFAALVVSANFLIEGDSSAPSSKSSSASGAERTVTVLRVVDGDTILVRGANGRSERVRYIGVDTPESVKPDSPVECFGREASDFNKQLVQGRKVRLVPDAEPEDKYGRSLAFVYVGDTFVNAQLIRGGYARTIEIEPNTSKAGYLADLERVAIRTRKGLWRACDR